MPTKKTTATTDPDKVNTAAEDAKAAEKVAEVVPADVETPVDKYEERPYSEAKRERKDDDGPKGHNYKVAKDGVSPAK